ncbi:MAG TPA: hypothetical protein VF316_02210 [Polyangiaceae bacterium]
MRARGWGLLCAALVACHHAADGDAEDHPDCEPLVLGAKPGVVNGKPVVILVYDSSRFRLERTEGATVAKELDSDAVALLVERASVVLHFIDMRCRKKLRARMPAGDASEVKVEVEE